MEADAERVEPADSEQDEEEDVYEVERIIDMRVGEREEVLYRVRWKNYCSDDDTWEPEAHLEDCREVLLAFKKNMAEVKSKKEAEPKKIMKLPTKSDVFDADSEYDSGKEGPSGSHLKVKKKKRLTAEEEESLQKEKRRKEKKKREENMKPLPAPETDEEEGPSPSTPPLPKEKSSEKKKRLADSDEEEEDEELAPPKKHRKDKGKEAGKHRKEKVEEGRKRKMKKERRVESSEDEATAPLEEDLSDEPSDAAVVEPAGKHSERPRSEERSKQKKGKSELKLQGFKDLLHDKKPRKDPGPSTKDPGLQKYKGQCSRIRQDAAPLSSDSSDSSSLHKKVKSKGAPDSAGAPTKMPPSSSSASLTSAAASGSSSNKAREEESGKEGDGSQKDAGGSTNLFEKFLLNCEAKDRVPRRHTVHQPAPAAETSSSSSSSSNKTPKQLIGKLEKKMKATKESPVQKPEPDKVAAKQPDAPRPSQSHGFSLDSDEKEVDDPAPRPRFGERAEEAQRPSWERRPPMDDRRWKKREDSEPRLFIACDDSLDPQDPLEDKGQATLSLGMDLNLDWMTLEDLQKHLNGEDEILSGPPLSPSELRDAVKSGEYMSVKLALNSKEEYNLDQEKKGKKNDNEKRRLAAGTLMQVCSVQKSSQSSCGFNLSMESTTLEEGTLRLNENILQHLDGPIEDQNLLGGFSCPNAGSLAQQVEDEAAVEGILNHHGNTGSDLLCFENDKLQLPVDPNTAMPTEMSFSFKQQSLDGDCAGISAEVIGSPIGHNRLQDVQPSTNDDQSQVDQWSRLSDAAEGTTSLLTADDDTTDKSIDINGAKNTKSKAGRRRQIKERRQPTRFSSRTSKKVLDLTLVEDEEEELSKRHFCLYCKNPFCRLLRHLELVHSDETDVAHAIHFPKGSKIRHNLLDQIRNKGDYEHNCRVLKSGEGEIVTKKNLNNPTLSVRDYLPCQHCLAFYRKTDLWKHERSCMRKEDQKSEPGTKRCRAQTASSRLLPMSEFLSGGCEEIIHIMHQDDVSHHVRNDPLICKYGNALSAKHDHDRSQFAYIAQKMRELGRFVLAANELDSSVQYLHEMCTPLRFDLAVEAAKKLAGFDPNSCRYKTVSLVSKIGYSLKRAAEIAFGESRMTEDCETEAQIRKFIHLLDKKWNQRFFRRARLAASHKQEFQKLEINKSTLTEDLIKLHRFVMSQGDQATNELMENPALSTWRKLSEATLTEVCLFNRGRVGNTGRMLLQEYNSKKSGVPFVPSADQIMKCTKLELELRDGFTRLELEGQGCRNMLILLTGRMVSSIDLLIEHRDKASVAKDNPYVFARSECLSSLRAFDCFRRAASECGVKQPEALLSSTLRDQVASYWQLMSLKEIELDTISKLLERSGKECSNLSENPSLLEEMSKQLLKMDRTLSSSPPQPASYGPVQSSMTKRKGWNEAEQAAVRRYLGRYISLMKVPGKKECLACIVAEPALIARSWTDVKSYVHNTLQTIRKKYYRRKASGAGDVKFLKPNVSVRDDGAAIKSESPDNKDYAHRVAKDRPSKRRENSAATAAAPHPQEPPPSNSGFSPVGFFKTNLGHKNTPMVPTFTPLNAQSFTPDVPRNTPLSPPYSPQHTTTMPNPPAYSPPQHTSLPVPPVYSPNTTSSPPLVPTFMPLNAPMVPRFTPLNDSSSNMVSSFTPLNRSGAPVYPASPPGTHATAEHASARTPSVHDRAPAVKRSAPAALVTAEADRRAPSTPPTPLKTQKRAKRLWSAEEQTAVKRQLGDICSLSKVPGKKECDACLAAEPALGSRSWREVKYYVHNMIQSKKRRGFHPSAKHTVDTLSPGVSDLSAEWDAPVYLSL